MVLLVPALLLAAGCAKEPKVEVPAGPAPLTVTDVTGAYVGSTMANGTDSVLSSWTSVAMTNASGGLEGRLMDAKAPTDSVAFTGVLSGDSVIWSSAPYLPAGAAAGSPQLKWVATGHVTGNAWTGTAITMIAATDSVVQNSRWTATRTP
jgi:hypothetical protein